METIIIKLSPGKLKNPDLDLRYLVPDRIEEVTGGAVQDNGYDYLDDGDSSLCLWLETQSAEGQYPGIVELLKRERFCENDLSQSAEVYISHRDCDELGNCVRVYPAP